MAEALTIKKRIQAGHKGSAMKTAHQITEVLEGDPPDHDRLSLLRATLKEKLDTIKTLDAKLIEDEGGLADEIKQADGYKETLHECILKVDQFLKATPPSPAASALTIAAATLPTNTHINRIKLPKLQLRSFDGDLTK